MKRGLITLVSTGGRSGRPTRFLGGAGIRDSGATGAKEKNEPQGQTGVRRTPGSSLIPSAGAVGRPAGCRLLPSVRCHRSDRRAEIAKGLACASIASTNSDLTTLCTVNSGQPTRFLGGAGIRDSGATGAKEKNEPQGQTGVRRTPGSSLIPSAGAVGRPAGCRLLPSVRCHRSDRRAEIAKGLACASIASTNSDLTTLCTVNSGQPTRFLGGAGIRDSGATGAKEKNEPQGQTGVRRTPGSSLIPSAGAVGREKARFSTDSQSVVRVSLGPRRHRARQVLAGLE